MKKIGIALLAHLCLCVICVQFASVRSIGNLQTESINSGGASIEYSSATVTYDIPLWIYILFIGGILLISGIAFIRYQNEKKKN